MEKQEIKVRVYVSCCLTKAPKKYKAKIEAFIRKLKKSKVTFIQVVIYNDGVYTFKFNTKNLTWDH